ncbi:energy-coupling factor transporter transmembrane component T [Ligilactobacillus apodemi]|nr:energy-coupling factor transporter transmembrane component T [Ligilactobacillus apodemi]
MKMFRLNASILVLIMFGLGLQIAFSHSFLANLVVCCFCLGYLLLSAADLKKLGLVLLFTLPLALGTWWSFIKFSTQDPWQNALLYTSRLYAYLLLGASLLLSYSLEKILFSLSYRLKLSTTFVYGFLAAANLLSSLKKQLQVIRYSAYSRGTKYHFYRPGIYLRLVVTALSWSEALAQAMTAQGFSEGYPRTRVFSDSLPKWQWGLLFLSLIGYLALVIWT